MYISYIYVCKTIYCHCQVSKTISCSDPYSCMYKDKRGAYQLKHLMTMAFGGVGVAGHGAGGVPRAIKGLRCAGEGPEPAHEPLLPAASGRTALCLPRKSMGRREEGSTIAPARLAAGDEAGLRALRPGRGGFERCFSCLEDSSGDVHLDVSVKEGRCVRRLRERPELPGFFEAFLSFGQAFRRSFSKESRAFSRRMRSPR